MSPADGESSAASRSATPTELALSFGVAVLIVSGAAVSGFALDFGPLFAGNARIGRMRTGRRRRTQTGARASGAFLRVAVHDLIDATGVPAATVRTLGRKESSARKLWPTQWSC